MRISDWSSDVCSSDLAAAHGLAGFLHQLDHFLERQRRRFAVLGNAAVEPAVADVGAVAAVEDLDVAAVEFLDDAVAGDLFLFLEDRKSTRSELQSLMRISYAVFCLKKKNIQKTPPQSNITT